MIGDSCTEALHLRVHAIDYFQEFLSKVNTIAVQFIANVLKEPITHGDDGHLFDTSDLCRKGGSRCYKDRSAINFCNTGRKPTETLTDAASFHVDAIAILNETPRPVDIHIWITTVILRFFDRRIVEKVRLIDNVRVDRLKISPH
jgi:hypothetical protein